MGLVQVDTKTLGDLEDFHRGRKANKATVELFKKAVEVMELSGVYVGWDKVYEDKQQAYDSVATVLEYAKRRGYILHQRLMPEYTDGKLKGYRCVVRAAWSTAQV